MNLFGVRGAGIRRAALFGAALLASGASFADSGGGPHERGIPADEALALLKDGNARFAEGKPRHLHEGKELRAELEKGQKPFAIIVGCSDSRVPPELVFDRGLGDLFIIRVAGNVAESDVLASVEYAVDHLGTNLVVVLGHSHCGAVTAAVDHLGSVEGEASEVVSLLYDIEPAVTSVPKDLPREDRIQQVVEKNVAMTVRRLTRAPDLAKSRKQGHLKIAGAVYDLHTGRVSFLDPEKAKP